MTNPETIKSENTEGMFARIFDRLGMLRKYKDDLLNILNDLEGAGSVISKIQHGNIITVSEYNLLKSFLKSRGLHTDISSVYDQVTLSCNKEGTLNDLNNFNKLVDNYPFVVDADEVSEGLLGSLPEQGMAEIRKKSKRGLVKKEKEYVDVLFYPSYGILGGMMRFSKDEYKEHGLIEVKNDSHGDNNSYNIMFLQKKENNSEFTNIGSYEMLQGFDRDGIGFCMYGGGKYGILHKDVSPQGIKIYEVGISLESTSDNIKKGFDEFNTFKSEYAYAKGKTGTNLLGKVTLRKSYDDSGKSIGIYAFKKKRFGGEEQVRAREKSS